MKKRKAASISRAKATLRKKERDWSEKIEMIKFQVANKPLLVEQVSKAFMRNL